MTPNDLLAAGYRMGLRMVHMMCDDLTDHEFRHQPVPGEISAAWIVGHLAVTIRRTAERFGVVRVPGVGGQHLLAAEPEVRGVRPQDGPGVDLAAEVLERLVFGREQLLGPQLRVARRLLHRDAPDLAGAAQRGPHPDTVGHPRMLPAGPQPGGHG